MSEIKEDFKKPDAQEILHSHDEKTRTPNGTFLSLFGNLGTCISTLSTIIGLNQFLLCK